MKYEELSDYIAGLMVKYGPDGHCDGHDLIATEIFERVKEWKEPEHEHAWKDDWGADGFYRCSICGLDANMDKGMKSTNALKQELDTCY